MKKLSNFLCIILAGAMALGIVISLVTISWFIAVMCAVSVFGTFAVVGIAFFVAAWIILNSMFKDLDLTFDGDDEDLM